MKILIVDDEPKNLELLEALLYPEKYETINASTGEEALRILGETQVDIVLLDVMLPGISGIEVLKTIRADKLLQTLPVLLITALADREHKILGLRAGADDYIPKPFDKDELIARLRTHAQLSYLRRQIAEKEKFEKVIEATNEGIIVTDNKYAPVVINRAAAELLKIGSVQPKDIIAHINALFTNVLVAEELGKDMKGHVLERAETEMFGPLYLSLVAHKIIGPSGEILQYILILKNITAEYLERKLKYSFLSLISHKFRTPLTVMGGSVELLSTLIKDPSLLEFVKKIGKSHQELGDLLNRLLRFIQVDSKDLEEAISVDIVDSIVSKRAQKYALKYVLNKNITTENIAFWQSMLLEELIDNSFKFHTGAQLSLDLAISENSMELCDNGPGIPQEEKEMIFKAFYQVDKDFTGQIPGLGLGLAIVRKLVKLHSGNIELENSAVNGTCIKIKLEKTGIAVPVITEIA